MSTAAAPSARALLLGLPRLGASLVAATLEEAGLEAMVAADMRAAPAVVSGGEIDVCIVDLDFFGNEALDELRDCAARWPSARTIGIAARPSAAQTDALVRRPFAPRQLLDALGGDARR